jgi:hypothetical protein
MWVWSIETIIDEMAYKNNLKNSYDNFKNKFNLYKLPNLDSQTLMLFLSMFFINDIFKNTNLNDDIKVINYD